MGYSRWCIHWVNAELVLHSLGTTIDNHCPKTYDLLPLKDNLDSLWLSLWGKSCFLFLPIFWLDFCFQTEVKIARIVGTDSEGEIGCWMLKMQKEWIYLQWEMRLHHTAFLTCSTPSHYASFFVLFLHIFCIWLKIHAKIHSRLKTDPMCFVCLG